MPQTVQVAVNSATYHFDKLYSYRVPEALQDNVFLGSMVLVPFARGNKPRMGVVLGCEKDENPKLKELYDAAPEDARLTPDLLKLVYHLKETTFCTYYEAVKAVIPYGAQYKPTTRDGHPCLQCGVSRSTEPEYTLIAPLPEKPKPGPKQVLAVKLLQSGPKAASVLAQAGVSRTVLDGLVKKEILQKSEVYKTLDLFSHIRQTGDIGELTREQESAFIVLSELLQQNAPKGALLHGVTGSGKTLVFLHLIRQALDMQRTVLVLVPEISLTPQMIYRLKTAFGQRVAVQHSALNNTERLLQWRMIQQGGADIVVGTRSAIFAPLQNLGLIVLDEEQEHTYQSESSPRFDAREIARLRASENHALLLLASATPSTETYYAAQKGRLTLVQLTQRYGGKPLPTVEMVDMRAEVSSGNASELSRALATELQKNLAAKEQSILLLNRRGYRTVAACADCGHVIKCSACSVPMVYHKAQNRLLCHYCGQAISPPPTRCPECGGTLRYTGFGTQRVEEELARLLPEARVLRMDQDSTGQKNAHEKMLAQFAAGEYDILLGTQMVAKGLDFARVSLVGVLGIDSLLFGQGFRAYESVFSLVTQVVGRGGRADIPGRAIIQTIDPNHPVLQLAAKQDYAAFFRQEIAFRKLCLYPPFCTLCVVAFNGEKEPGVIRAAQRFAILLGTLAAKTPGMPLRVLGPAPMGIVMMNGRYRYKLTLKSRGDAAFRALLAETLGLYAKEGLPAQAAVTVDFHSDGD